MQYNFILVDGLIDARKAVERNHRIVAIRNRARLNIHHLRLLFADLVQAFRDVFLGDFRLAVVHRDAAIVPQLDLRRHFEFGLEAQRLAFVEMHVFDVRTAHHFQMFFFHLLPEIFRQQVFENVVAHLLGELGADQAGGRFSRTKAGELSLLLDTRDNAIRLAGDLIHGDSNFDFVLATFN